MAELMKSFLIKLDEQTADAVQLECKVSGRSQQSFFALAIANAMAGNIQNSGIIPGLLAELIAGGEACQQALLDTLVEDRMVSELEALKARKLARAAK